MPTPQTALKRISSQNTILTWTASTTSHPHHNPQCFLNKLPQIRCNLLRFKWSDTQSHLIPHHEMAKCPCVWGGNRLTQPRFPCCIWAAVAPMLCPWAGLGWSPVQAGLGCAQSRSQGHQLNLGEWGSWLAKNSSDKISQLKGQEVPVPQEVSIWTMKNQSCETSGTFLWSWTFNGPGMQICVQNKLKLLMWVWTTPTLLDFRVEPVELQRKTVLHWGTWKGQRDWVRGDLGFF